MTEVPCYSCRLYLSPWSFDSMNGEREPMLPPHFYCYCLQLVRMHRSRHVPHRHPASMWAIREPGRNGCSQGEHTSSHAMFPLLGEAKLVLLLLGEAGIIENDTDPTSEEGCRVAMCLIKRYAQRYTCVEKLQLQ